MTTSASGSRLADRRRMHRGGEADDTNNPIPIGKLVFAGLRAACTCAAAGLATVTILVVTGWVAAPHTGLSLIGVLRTAAVLWLVAHHVLVQVAQAGRIGMLPLGLVLLPGALLWRAGRAVARSHVSPAQPGYRQALRAALVIAVPYTTLAAVLAIASRSAIARASLPQAVLASFVIAFIAAGLGAARALAPWTELGAPLTPMTRSVLAGMVGSLAVLGGAGTLATAMALASHVHEFTAIYGSLDPGLVGAGLLFIGQLAYLPNAAAWAIAYMLGPGFAVGAGTVVAPTGSVIGQLPAFPLLASLPLGTHGSRPVWLAVLLLAVPYLAGVIGGLLVARIAPTAKLEAAAIRAFGAGALTGAVLGLLAAFAGGPLGNGRLAYVGPSAWQVAAVGALEVGIAAAISAGAANWRHARANWANRRSQTSEAEVGESGRSDSDEHVIYMDAWATGQATALGVSGSGDPSALPRHGAARARHLPPE